MFASEQLGKWDLVQLDQNRVKLSVLNPMILRSNLLQYHLSIKDPVLRSQICTKMPIFIILGPGDLTPKGHSDVLLQNWVDPDSVLALELLIDVPFLETIEINQPTCPRKLMR